MISRPEEGGAGPSRTGRYLLWALVALALGVGIAIALRYGPGVTPLLDSFH